MDSWIPRQKLEWLFLVLRNVLLTSTAKTVAAILEGYANNRGECWPSKGLIARILGKSPKTVGRSLAELEGHGFLRITPRIGTSNIYRLLITPPRDGAVGDGLDGDVSGKEHTCPSSGDMGVPQILNQSENKIFRSSPLHQPGNVSKKAGKEGSLQNHRQKKLGTNFLRRPDRGRYEVEVASRLGPNGLAILSSLPKPKLAWLLRRAHEGTLTREDLAEICLIARSRNDGGGGG